MGQLLYTKHRPSLTLLTMGTAGMLFFWNALRQASRENSGIKISKVLVGWAFIMLLLVHGPIAKIVNEYTSLRPLAETIKKVSKKTKIMGFCNKYSLQNS